MGDLRRGGDLTRVGLAATALVEPHATLADALNELITSNGGCAIVVGPDGAYQGIVDLETIMAAVRTMREQHAAFYLAQKSPSQVGRDGRQDEGR